MFCRHSRIIAAVVLCFFTWTSGGLFSVAHSAQDAVKNTKQEAPAKKSDSAEERFAKVMEELTTDLNDPKIGNEGKKLRLTAAKVELDSLDADIRKQFAETEKKLKDTGLPPEILARHVKFVKHYDDNLAELKGNLALVEGAKDAAEFETALEKTRQHLAKVKAPSLHQKLDPNNLPHRQPKVIKREPRMKKEEFDRELNKDKQAWKSAKRIMVAANGSVAGLLPSEDLAETVEVQLTPEIRAKALDLGNSPVKIYEWVRNNFKYESYYGSLKGAQQTLLEKSGNDFDQASLLIALLRAANVPAKYVYGTIELPIERVMTWLGVKDPTVALNIIASGGIPAKAGLSGGKITSVLLEHVWVEAFVNMYPSFGARNGPGNAWTPIDSSFKEHELNTSVDMSKIVPFNEADYLRTQSKLPPSLTYLFALEDYHTGNYQGGMHEMFYLKKIKEHEFGILPGTLPYKTVVVASKFLSIDVGLRHKISIGLRDPFVDESISVAKNTCEITGKKITVSYAPATDADRAVMTNYGGLLKTPTYLVKVKAEVRIDDTAVLEGPAVSMGDSLKLSLQFNSPGSYTETIETDMAAGVYYTVGMSALNVADRQAIGALDNSENLMGTFYDSINSGDEQVGKVLHNIGLQYFTHTNNASRLLEGVMHIYNTRAVNAGFVSVSSKYRMLFGITVSPPIIAGLNIDIPRYIQSPFSITGDKEQEKAFTKIQGLNTSYFEHAIWESFSGIDSVSTVKLLQLANDAGQPIYTINSANLSQTLPLLNQSQYVKENIQNVVAVGKEVTIPGSYITRNEWQGTGYMVRNPDTGEGAYMISSGLAGGCATGAPSALRLQARKYAAVAVGAATPYFMDPFWIIPWEIDILFARMTADLFFSAGYIPRYEEVNTKAALLNLVNRTDNEIIYYTGHGTSNTLVPGRILELDENVNPVEVPTTTNFVADHVFSTEFNQTNARIVFLNSCDSMKDYSFSGRFGEKTKILVGWSDKTSYLFSGEIGFSWWWNMIIGKQIAVDAAKNIDNKKYRPEDPTKLTLRIIGEEEEFYYSTWE